MKFFPRDKNRQPSGLGYQCRECERAAHKRRPPRPSNYRKLTPELRASHQKRQKRYHNGRGWSVFKVGSYRYFDKKRGLSNDLTAAWFRDNIESKPCFYCGDASKRSGGDRIDNSKGHTKNNVVPSCWDCNCTRGNRFSHEEMIIISDVIRTIKATRVPIENALDRDVA